MLPQWLVSLLRELLAPFRSKYGFVARGSDRSRYAWEAWVRKGELLHRSELTYSPDLLDLENALGHCFSEKHVWAVRNGIFDFAHGVVYLKGVGVSESTSWPAYTRVRRRPIALSAAKKIKLQGPVAAASQHRWNFYHWLIEDLPPLIHLSQEIPDLIVLIKQGAPGFVIESLEFFGIHYQFCSGLLRVPELVFVGRGDDTGWAHPWDIQQIRLNATSIKRSRKIYISRRNSSRSPRHEASLESWLSSIGFEVVFLEKLSFTLQVKVLSEASVVVAQHGAGLSNLVFAAESTRVIEIFERGNVNQCFQRLSEVCKHDYRWVIFDSQEEASSVIRNVEKALR